MKKPLFILFFISLFLSCSDKKTSYEDEIKLFQYELNTQYANAEESPLTEEDLKTFKALDFFEINENYKVTAEFELTPNTPIFEMPTTTERLPLYRKYGIAKFNLNGKNLELSLYQNQNLMNSLEYKNYLFLPFNDASNSKTTYGGGRFIDLEIPKKGSKTIIIDFNKAYNPYCAYNHKFSCPIPPAENNLPIDIPVGVKNYNK
ncbi:hypothetical protein BX611_2163 [Lutibacter oceani]|uniref:DUF1684 domain-containing protein n=1 Tax=Lutibacter oceani TaxID=1853311 RepID=A0A3D9RLT8_9FLAO|nr:DUF1684 domain-containing protein [Lutibacter oceani]REE80518.1 hypothetical protein BX611_2163 [Lutibacter oceani]